MKRLVALLWMLLAVPLSAQQLVNLRDADIRAFIGDVARVTGRSFVIDPRVQGKVTVVSETPLSMTGYFELFLATLRANGYVAVPAGNGAFRVQPVEGSAAQGSSNAGRNGFRTEVVQLVTLDPAAAVEALRPLTGKDGQVTAARGGSAVVIADFADNVRRLKAVLARLDRPRGSTDYVALKNADAAEIAAALTGLGGGDNVVATAVPSANAVLLRGSPAGIARLTRMARDLDGRAASGSEIRVIFLEHADAGELLPVLRQLAGSAAAEPADTGLPPRNTAAASGPAPSRSVEASQQHGGPVITRYEGANALIIAGPADLQRRLAEVIRRLDTRQAQVLVEAIIVEISDNAARKLGVQFLLSGTGGSAIPLVGTNFQTAPNLTAGAAAVAGKTELAGTTALETLRNAAVGSLLGVTGGLAGLGGRIGNDAVFGFVINAVKSDTESNILSTPSVMTLDNVPAKILVGQEIPVTTGQALSNNFDNRFVTVQRQNVGIQLEVRPQINAGGTIKLFLRQEVSSIAGPVSAGSSELILNKREIETTVSVDDGQIVALGGLLDDNRRSTVEKIPLLGDIPGLGVLFRSKARSRVKTNLMVFIRPTIIRSAADAGEVAARRFESSRNRDAAGDSALDDMVRAYMATEPPRPAKPAK